MQGMLLLNGISVESVARMYFSKNPKHENAVIVMSGTMKFEDALREWKPEREYYCMRKGLWLSGKGEQTTKYEAMT